MEPTRWKFFTLLFAVLPLFFLDVLVNAAAVSSASREAESQGLEKRQSPPPGFYPILGAQSKGGKCYPRRNIEVLRDRHPNEFNMLILALSDLQKNPGPNPDLTWFGVGGIHGAPFIPWQQPEDNGPFNEGLGYCVHASPLFTLWHRPYVLLLEQLLHQRAVRIANKFTDKNRGKYQDAADRLRLPYMDWSDPAYLGGIPSSASSPQIDVVRPSASGKAQKQTIDNPFYRYNFRTNELSQLPGLFGTYEYTTRDPDGVSARPISGDDNVDIAMMNDFITRRQNTFNLFALTAFNSFASQCEAIHNGIHVTIGAGRNGGRGHMGTTTAAAFDPIFWLHHANIDRLIAMYQVVYPNNQLAAATPAATYGRVVPGRDGPQDTLDTNLYPFRKMDGSMYKGQDFVSGSTGIWNYKYGYPEIPCKSSASATQLSSNVRTAINNLYRPDGVSPLRRRQNETLPVPPAGPVPGEQSGFAPVESEIGLVRTEYSLRMFIDLAEIVGLWTCHIFLGEVPSSPNDYLTSKNRCGVFAPLTAQGKNMLSMPYTYDFALTDKLLSLGVSSNQTSTYLTDNLKYVIVGETGTIIDPSSLKTFKAGICTWQGTYGQPDSDKLASFGDCTVLYHITEEKPGGVESPKELQEPTLLDGTTLNLNETLKTF